MKIDFGTTCALLFGAVFGLHYVQIHVAFGYAIVRWS